MDITKVYTILKKSLYIDIAQTSGGGQWIGDQKAYYNVDGLPELDKDCILPLIGVDIDTKAKYNVRVCDMPYEEQVSASSAEGDGMIEPTSLIISGMAVFRGVGKNAPPCVFLNAAYLKPFSADGDISYIVRKVPNQAGYVILAKRGLITIAFILPIIFSGNDMTSKLISDLENVIATIKQQQGKNDTEEHFQLSLPD